MAVKLSATYRSLISAGCAFKALSSIPRRDHLDMDELKWPSVVLSLEVRAGWMIMRKVVQPKSRREELVNDPICEHPKDLAKSWDQIKHQRDQLRWFFLHVNKAEAKGTAR